MHADVLAVVISIAALLGQLLNVHLSLRMRTAVLESERKILAEVSCEFARKPVCDARMEGVEDRLDLLERRASG